MGFTIWLLILNMIAFMSSLAYSTAKVDKLKKEIIEKDRLISAFVALDKAIKKLNDGFKEHERRINNVEEFLVWEKSEEHEEPEKPYQLEYTCKDCEYYRTLYGNYYMCKQTGCFCSTECDTPCDVFKKKESLDEDENVVYANNVKINISSKGPRIYMTDGIITSEELADRIRKLYLDGGINFADAQIILERLKQ